MLHFLKWIFFVFGGLGLAVMSFFFVQNKHDLGVAWDYKSQLDYDYMKQTCLNVEKDYYYPCFEKKFEEYLEKVSITGMSLGLKMAFNFIDEDKQKTTFFENEIQKDLTYSFHYLKLNNLAISNSFKRFFGLEFTYGGFVGKVKDNLEKASLFSDGIIKGLKSEEGISKLNNPVLEEKFHMQLSQLEQEYAQAKDLTQKWLDKEVARLEQKYGKL